MNEALLESLLYRSESETLDFKECQYPFAGATTEQKAELLKDVLAFANAWRDIDAHILIGVREVKGAKSTVTGVQAHLDDHSLLQFVSSKTNRPVPFSYSAFPIDGLQIGVLTVSVSEQRPFFLNDDFGRLRRNTVYIRRGSATVEATPDEVLRMAAKAAASAQPVLHLEFCDGSTRERMGQSIELHPEMLKFPDSHAFPSYGRPANYEVFGSTMPSGSIDNNDYYVEVGDYLKARHAFSPVSVAVSNSSQALAESVVITIKTDAAAGIRAADADDLPDFPSRFSLRAAHPSMAGSTHVTLYGSIYEIKVDIGNVQPGRTAYFAQPFYVSSECDLDATIEATISANNLSSPVIIPLIVALKPAVLEVTIAQIVEFANAHS
jgi:hypothetical protein